MSRIPYSPWVFSRKKLGDLLGWHLRDFRRWFWRSDTLKLSHLSVSEATRCVKGGFHRPKSKVTSNSCCKVHGSLKTLFCFVGCGCWGVCHANIPFPNVTLLHQNTFRWNLSNLVFISSSLGGNKNVQKHHFWHTYNIYVYIYMYSSKENE